MILKRILLVLFFLSLPLFVFSQDWGQSIGLTSGQVQNTTGWKRIGTTNFLDSRDNVIAIENGSILFPSISFRTDLDTGVFLQTGGTLGIVGNGVETARFASTVAGVNCFLFTPAIAGAQPIISVAGADTDIGLSLAPKNSGIVEVQSQIKITGGNPGINKVLTSDSVGLASWTLASGGGFTDVGTTIILTNINDSLGIGESGPDTKFHVTNGGSAGTVTAITNTIATFESPGAGYVSILTPNASERGIFFGEPANQVAGGIIYNNSLTPDGFQFRTNSNTIRMVVTSAGDVGIGTSIPNGPLDVRGLANVIVGGFLSGQIQITNPDTDIFASAGISGHNLNGVNKALWFVGSDSPLNDDLAIKNYQGASLKFYTNNISRMTIDPNGNVSGNQFTVTRLTSGNLRLDGNVLSSENADGPIFITPNGAGAILLNTDRVLLLGSSIGETGDNSELMEIRDDRVTTGSAPNYIFAINRQNSATSAFWLGNNGNGDGSIITNNQPLIFGNDVASVFTEHMRIEADGRVGIGTNSPDVTALLDLSSTTLGFLQPRMTTTQRDAISSPGTGLSLFDLTLDKPIVRTSLGFKTLLTEDIGQVVVQETFASTNVRFFGELALPAAQGWTDIATGSATIVLVNETVFGELRQVVRHADNVTNGSTTSQITLTTQNWVDINAFGASYGGTARLNTAQGGSGFFSGLQANAAENPLVTGNRRYGVLFDNNAGNLRIIEADDNPGNSVTMDGTGGNPLVTFDEWFRWECVVPAGLGAAQLYVNGILTTFIPTFLVNGGGLGTRILISSGSTGGTGRVVSHDNFGVTIYEEAATKTLAATTMVGDVAQINIPEGKRDYVIILPDGNPRLIGSVLRLVANNLGGSVELQNVNPAVPEILYNGLRTLVLEIAVKEVINGVNTVNSGNVYIGFKAEDVDRSNSIFAQLHSIVDQIPTDVNPTVITYTNHDAINGIGHSTTLNTGELEILPGFEGTYFIMAQPQVGKTSGATAVDFDMFLQVDRGSGFVDEPNSNIKLSIKDQDVTDVIVSGFTILLSVGDKIRMMQKTSDSGVGMGLKNTDAIVGPPTVPRTPSIIFTMFRVGG